MAYPASLVDQVMVDVGEMKIGDVIRVKDLSLAADPDITIKTNPESIVVSLMASHNVEAPAEIPKQQKRNKQNKHIQRNPKASKAFGFFA